MQTLNAVISPLLPFVSVQSTFLPPGSSAPAHGAQLRAPGASQSTCLSLLPAPLSLLVPSFPTLRLLLLHWHCSLSAFGCVTDSRQLWWAAGRRAGRAGDKAQQIIGYCSHNLHFGGPNQTKKKKKKSWSLKLYVLSELFVHELLERVLSRLMVEQLGSAVCAQRFATKASPAQHLQPTLFHTGTPSATAALLTTPSSVPVPPQDYRITECQSG